MINVIDFQYFPNVSVISALVSGKNVIFEAYESFQKGGFRTRCEIAGSSGRLELRIPLSGGRTQKAIISTVQIDEKENWPEVHYRSLRSCYRRSPFFEHYEEDLQMLFSTKFKWLIDWDLACMEWLISALNVDLSMGKTNDYRREYDSEIYRDLRSLASSGHPVLPGTRIIPYQQVFSERTGFLPSLSTLDLLFCEGPRASVILQSMWVE